MPGILLTDDHVTIAYENEGDEAILPITVYCTDPKWDEVLTLVRNSNYNGIRSLMNETADNILSYGNGRVSIQDGLVVLDENPVEGPLIDRMLKMFDLNIDVTPLTLFLVNLYDNPQFRAVNESYGFIEASDLTITSDGHLLAYKRVREDYMDIHSGKFDNSIGSVCWMHRNKVDDDKTKTCSAGLHFCGRDYLPSYGTWGHGYRTMVVKINPRDIVSIPEDYNNHKGRCCRYEVVGELENDGMHLEGLVTDNYDDVPAAHAIDPQDWNFETDDEAEATVESDINFDLNAKMFPSRKAAREYASANPSFVVRDRGPGTADRWHVALRTVSKW